MKTFKYTIDGKELSIRLDEKLGTIADIAIDGSHPEVTEAEMPIYAAVIALALIEREVEVVHDDEPGVITLAPQSNVWATPADLMNRL
ncbi:MAG: hypothetical protein IJZ92_07465 [Bacteroidaceae bacterium]|nr:hypothetical protein [Bacteroidaceae bacterium]